MSLEGPVVNRMAEIAEQLVAENDERQHFHSAYLRSTRSVLKAAAAGEFVDAAWTEQWGLAFAQLYLDAFDAWERGAKTPGPWRVAFGASQNPDIPPVRHALLGINAHINYDLPQAFLAVITDAEFRDPEVMRVRATDHAHVDSILVSRVVTEDKLIAKLEEPGDRTWLDRLMTPLNRSGTKRFLKEGREKVWRNAKLLSEARAQGRQAYTERLAELEDLCDQRVTDLVAPRHVIMRLARHGFGVSLSEA